MSAFPRPHISPSERSSFKNCEFRWKLDYVDGHRTPIYGVHLDFGTAMHSAIERHKTRKDPVPLEETVQNFRSSFTETYSKNKEKYSEKDLKNDLGFFLDAGENILRHFHECEELSSAEVLYNEFPLFEKIDRTDGIDISFKGFIDMTVRTKSKRGETVLYVCDFKTCSWGWDIEKKRDREVHFQVLLYKHFLCKKFGLDPKGVRTAFVLLKKKPKKGDPPVEWFPISAGPISVQRAVDALNEDITKMSIKLEAGTLQKNRSVCVNSFGDTCPYFNTDLCPDDR